MMHSASGPALDPRLSVDKVWRRESGELSGCVRDVLQAFRGLGYTLLEIVNLAVLDTALEIFHSGGADFFDTSTDSAGGALNIRIGRRSGDYRRAVTMAAYKRVVAYGHSPTNHLANGHMRQNSTFQKPYHL